MSNDEINSLFNRRFDAFARKIETEKYFFDIARIADDYSAVVIAVFERDEFIGQFDRRVFA